MTVGRNLDLENLSSMHMEYITISNLSFIHFRDAFTVGKRKIRKIDKLGQIMKKRKNKLLKMKEKGVQKLNVHHNNILRADL